MSDTLMGVTETSATALDVISSIIQEALVANQVLFGSVSQFPAPMGSKQVEIPRSGLPTVNSKSENVAASAVALTYATDVITLDQHKYVQYLIEDIAKWQSNIALIEDSLMKAGKQLASDLDAYIFSKLINVSTSNPDNYFDWAGAAPARVDILEHRKLLNAQNVPQSDRYLAIHPTQEKALLNIDDFIHADKYGSASALQNGELGRIFGFKVLMSTNVTEGTIVAYHKSHVACGYQVMPRVQRDLDLPMLAERLSIDHLFGAVELDSGKRGTKSDVT